MRMWKVWVTAWVTAWSLCGSAAAMEHVPSFGRNPGNLVMFLHVPSVPVMPMPVVLVLHGCGQQGPAYAETTGWRALADQLGFALVVAEQQVSNNAGGCFNWFEPEDQVRNGGEAASLLQMVEHVQSVFAVNTAAVFVTGLSAGGGMTAVMMAAYPEVFAAGAPIAGVPYGCATGTLQAAACMGGLHVMTADALAVLVNPNAGTGTAWPRISVWQGNADVVVAPVNADQLALQWTAVRGLSRTPDRTDTSGNHIRRQWLVDGGQARVEQHTVVGMGHGTPVDPASDCGAAAPYVLSVGICSASEIARFFGLVPGSMGPVDAGMEPDAAPPRMDAGPALDRDAGGAWDAQHDGSSVADRADASSAVDAHSSGAPAACACTATDPWPPGPSSLVAWVLWMLVRRRGSSCRQGR